jgi:NAD(P)-dependent dehydrogenase (short-subunit alcohol dehydrogenase family)
MNSPVWFITGAARGFGLEIAHEALDRGGSVVAAARDPRAVERALGKRDTLFPLELDVTDERRAQAAASAALERFGRIDVLVNNAGRGLLGAVEESSADEVRAILAVNVEGALNVTRAVLPSMRVRRSGCIVNMSSVGGFVAWAGWGVYAATKFALEGLSEAMRGELAPLGIRVIIVEPGVFRTDFLDASSLARTGRKIDDYDATVGETRKWSDDKNHAQQGDPAKAARAIVAAATSSDPPLRLQLGGDSVARIEEKLDAVAKELAPVRPVALSTDFDGRAAAP